MTTDRITLDLDSLTLGELADAEEASGKDSGKLLTSSANRRMLAVFVSRLRSDGAAPSWNDLRNLRLLDNSSSASDSEPANLGAKSSD